MIRTIATNVARFCIIARIAVEWVWDADVRRAAD